MSRVTVRINRPKIAAFIRGGAPAAWVHEHTEKVRNAAVRRAPRDTGALAASLEATVHATGYRITGIVGSRLDYALYLHQGTGIYGPKKRPITPVSARVLRFKPRGGKGPPRKGQRGTSPERRGGWVFAQSVKGVPPHPFLSDALEIVVGRPVKHNPLR